VIFGEVGSTDVANLEDINAREALVLGSVAAAVLLVGLWPQPLVDLMHASVDQLLQHIQQPKFPAVG
jgi:NADH-quinone oxidoreductase subunit M